MAGEGEFVYWAIKAVILLLAIMAGSLAIKKKHYLALALIAAAFVLSIFFYSWISFLVSLAYLIWASSAKSTEQNKQPLKSSRTPVHNKVNMVNRVKPGTIIGLLIGICLVVFPIFGFINKEASLSDSTGQLIGIGFIIFGALMVIGNIITLIKGPAQETAAPATAPAPVKAASEEKAETGKKIRCRFCKKLYSSEYNGCPYCKKK